MTHNASFWHNDSLLVPLAMGLLALPIFLLCGAWAALYLALMAVRRIADLGMRLLEKLANS